MFNKKGLKKRVYSKQIISSQPPLHYFFYWLFKEYSQEYNSFLLNFIDFGGDNTSYKITFQVRKKYLYFSIEEVERGERVTRKAIKEDLETTIYEILDVFESVFFITHEEGFFTDSYGYIE
jgi:hypothetical protein